MPTTDPKSSIVHTWDYAEQNWNTEMDSNLKRISRTGYHLGALDADLGTPPGSPADGDTYLVPAGATGAWSGQDQNVAYWDGSAWVFYTPNEGWYADVADVDALYRFNGTAWAEYELAGGGPGTSGPWDFVETITFTLGQTPTISVPVGCAKLKIVGERVLNDNATYSVGLRVTGSNPSAHAYTLYRHQSNTDTPSFLENESFDYYPIALAGMSPNSIGDFEAIINLGDGSTYTAFYGTCTLVDDAAGSPVMSQLMTAGSYKTVGRPSSFDLYRAIGDISGDIHVYKSTF